MLHADDPVLEVAETCQLALQKMQYLEEHPDADNEESPYYSVDPTPAMPATTPIADLKAILLDEDQRMFDVRPIHVTRCPTDSQLVICR